MATTQVIKLTTDQMRLMSLFQRVTKTTARDCVEDERMDRVIFVVSPGKMGLAIGRGGANVRSLQNLIKKSVEMVEYDENAERFLRNVLNGKLISEIRMGTREDGTQQAIVTVGSGKKGIVVGRAGKNAERARLLARRYFGITNVMINSPERAVLEL